MTLKCSILFTITLISFWLVCVKCEEDPEHFFNSSNGVRIELKRQKSAYEQYINNIRKLNKKYGMGYFDWIYKKPKPHPPTTNDSIALKRYFDSEFYGEIVVGHPGQKMYVSFDTSWTFSWVMSEKCSGWTDFGCFFHNKYDDSKSPFHIPDGRNYTEHVGKDVYSGIFVYDNISIAHVNVTNQSFVEMEKVPFSEIFSKADGVLGLAPKYNDSYNPFFYTLLAQDKIKVPLFSVYLNRDKQSNRGGNVILGFIDKKHIHSKKDVNNKTVYDDIIYLSLQPSPYWQFSIDGIGIYNHTKETPIELCSSSGCTGITDTSSNNILGPAEPISKIHDQIKAKKFYFDRYTVNCDTINKLPRIDVTLNGNIFTLKGPDYIMKMTYMSFTICVSAFVPQDNYPKDFWVLGGAFLSEVYTIYNVEDKKIGFVKAA